MTELFGRRAVLTVGIDATREFRFEALDIKFSIKRSLARSANKGTIEIYNLSENTRASIDRVRRQRVRLEVGYGSDTFAIFEGDVRKSSSKLDGPTMTTTIEAADGERAMQSSRSNRSYGPGTTLRQVLEGLAGDLGVGLGNAIEQAGNAAFEGLGRIFENGTVVSGSTRRELAGICDGAGLEYSIQDNALQVLPRGHALASSAILLSPKTGLVGSPSLDTEGVMRARSLIIPGLTPGRRVKVESRFVNGVFRVRSIQYTGDTSANEWYADVEGKEPTA